MNYTEFIQNQYGEKINPNLFAVHFKKLAAYNKDWDLPKILVYELMLVMSRKTGHKEKGFYKQQRIIAEETRLSRHKVRKAIEALEEQGILNIRKSGGGRYYYKVKFHYIKENLEQVYNFNDVKQDHKKPLKRILTQFIDYHASTEYYEKQKTAEEENYIVADKDEVIKQLEEKYGKLE